MKGLVASRAQGENSPMNRIILADNQAIFRAGAAKVLAVEDDLRIVAQAQSAEQVTMSVSVEYDETKAVDEVCARASSLGAKIETQPTNTFWGTRFATLRDPFGHRWILNAPLEKKK